MANGPGKQPSQLPSKDIGGERRELLEQEQQAAAQRSGISLPEQPQVASVKEQQQQPVELLDTVLEANADAGQIGLRGDESEDELLSIANKAQAELDSLALAPESEFDMQPPAGEVPRPISAPQEFATRFVQNLGRNINEEKSLVKKFLGPDFEVKAKDEELFFRKKGSKRFFRLDREGFEGGLREVVADTFADFSGEMVEVAAGVGTLAAGAAAGTAIGAPGPGTLVGAAAAIPVASAAEVLARQTAIEAFEGEVSAEFRDEFMINTGLNAVTLGAGALVKKGVRRGINALKDVIESSPQFRIKKLAEVRQSFDEFREGLNRRADVAAQPKSPADIGQAVMDGVTRENNRLDRKLSLVKDLSIAKGGNQQFSSEAYLGKLSEILEKGGIGKDQQELLSNPKTRGEVIRNLRQAKVFGSESGADFVDQLAKEMNEITRKGGVTAREMFDKLEFWKKPSGFRRGGQPIQFPTEAQALSRQLRTALTQDRTRMLEDLFKDDAGRFAFLNSSFKEYSGKIDSINEFKRMFKSQRSAEAITRALVLPRKSQRVRDLKAILGDDSPEFNIVRANWFDEILKKSVDPATGVFQPRKLNGELKRFGPDLVDEMLSTRQQKALELMSTRAAKIPFIDMLTGASAEQFMKDQASIMLLNYRHPAIVVRALWYMTRGNAAAARYLADDGLLDIAVDQKNPIVKSRTISALESFNRLLDATDVKKLPDNRRVLKEINADAKLADPEVRKIIQRQLRSGETERTLRATGGLPADPVGGELPGAAALGAAQLPQAVSPAEGQ